MTPAVAGGASFVGSLLRRGLRVSAKRDPQLPSGVAYPFCFLKKGWGGLRLNFPVLLPRLLIARG